MNSTIARYYDTRSTRSTTVTLALDDRGWLVSEPAAFSPFPLASARIASRIGNTPRVISLPNGAALETDDHQAVDDWCRRLGRKPGIAHELERRPMVAVVALIAVYALMVAGGVWGIPWAASHLAHAMPESVVARVGSGSLELLDYSLLRPSELDEKTQDFVHASFAQLPPDGAGAINYRVALRTSDALGANAFAMPDGTIVLTDQFVELAETDGQVIAVLLHEIGHVVHRHGLQRVVAHAGLASLTVAVFGDIAAAGNLVVALPNVLLASAYSRDMEAEADAYALRRMDELGIDRHHFSDILELLSGQTGETESTNTVFNRYTSSHPATVERIAYILDEAQPE
jgi:Zn-dependent protease with chaperone function